ncbi:hypothetical protein [uncultured Pelagimonas sp.]|uniref:hypothetical protein n=1 Tax=uncultured Pelagimonas sp. TaxID=1618102 RepID=UPI00262485B5|nr:hypothetical protein [uncultured Pelagimonas sp.]
MTHAEKTIIRLMHKCRTVEDLRDFWLKNLGNSYKKSQAINAEKERLKGKLPPASAVQEICENVDKIVTRKGLERFWIEIPPEMRRHPSVREAAQFKVNLIARTG